MPEANDLPSAESAEEAKSSDNVNFKCDVGLLTTSVTEVIDYWVKRRSSEMQHCDSELFSTIALLNLAVTLWIVTENAMSLFFIACKKIKRKSIVAGCVFLLLQEKFIVTSINL